MTPSEPPDPTQPTEPTRRADPDTPRAKGRARSPIAWLGRIARTPAVAGMVRTWQGWVILVVVASQLLLPLHYYTTRRDVHDERFAWRMFSPMRLTDCAVRATLDGKPLALEREFHDAWIGLARRGRKEVIEQMGARLCEKYERKPVVFYLDCEYAGQPAQAVGANLDLCQVPYL